jgi:hypothetical protein
MFSVQTTGGSKLGPAPLVLSSLTCTWYCCVLMPTFAGVLAKHAFVCPEDLQLYRLTWFKSAGWMTSKCKKESAPLRLRKLQNRLLGLHHYPHNHPRPQPLPRLPQKSQTSACRLFLHILATCHALQGSRWVRLASLGQRRVPVLQTCSAFGTNLDRPPATPQIGTEPVAAHRVRCTK